MTMFGKGVGVLAKNIGSTTPTFVLDAIPDPDEPDHPFKVKFVSVSGAWHFKVVAGTVNDFVPSLDGTDLDANPAPTKSVGTTLDYVYLKCQYYTMLDFPYNVTVEKAATVPVDTDDYAYITIARIDATGASPVKTMQAVQTSLSAERIKCGNDDASYMFMRV